MKTCKRCNKEKPLKDFYEHLTSKDGHLNICIDCKRVEANNRKRRLRARLGK
jgi:hypothetical protein